MQRPVGFRENTPKGRPIDKGARLEGTVGSRPVVGAQVPTTITGCAKRKADGRPCKANPVGDTDTCWFHSR